MEHIWILIIAGAIFLIWCFVFYNVMKGYVKEEFGKKWLSIWGNKVYFWQSLVFMSLSGMVLTMYLLKWVEILSF